MRWLALFTIVLLGISAVPVLADSPPTEPPPASEVNWASESETQAPNAAEITEALQKVEEQEAAKQSWLESPKAEAEREESQDAYAGASPSEAAALLEGQFSEQLGLIDQDPARALTEAKPKLDRVLGTTEALVTVDGHKLLMEGPIPVRVPTGDGELSKVDLNLVGNEEEFTPANPITDVTLPRQASDGLAVGDSGLAITPALPEGNSNALPFGDRDILYPETQTDLSLLASPISDGLELSSEMLSAESPEELRFNLSLPSGAELRSDGDGGAEVSREGKQIATIPAPAAVDAQGTEVPVTMRVEGSAIVLSVELHNREVAFPLLVDPTIHAIQEDWYNGGNSWYNGGGLWALEPNTSPWVWGTTNGGRFWAGTHHIYSSWGGSDRGLFISATSTEGSQEANKFGQFTYTAPGSDSFISAALINPFWRDDHGCSIGQYPEPHDYSGLWNETWGWATFHSNWAHTYGYGIETPFEQLEEPNTWRAKTGHVLVIGMGTGNGSAKIPCWRDIYAGGVTIYMDDWYSPTLSSVTGMPSGWLRKDETPHTIEASASDTGLGVQEIRLLSPGDKAWPWNHGVWCTGLANSRCPGSASGQITFTTEGFYEGEVPVSVQALDPTGKGENAASYKLLVDGTSPTVELNGQLAKITAEAGTQENKDQSQGNDELSLPTYNLAVKATDGSKTEPRSGVKEIKLFLDGSKTPLASQSQPCTQGSCEMTMNYTLKLPGLSDGGHTLKVVAIDQVGNETPERKIEFEYHPATGMQDEYALQHIPLPDGHNYEEEPEYRGPELAVNVMNGNLVYRERDVNVKGARADLQLERSYNSQLPATQKTQWGKGWTVAQEPELTPVKGESTPSKATMRRTTGAITNAVQIPTESKSEPVFNPKLHASIDKTPSGGYEVKYEGGAEETSHFSSSGKIEETSYPTGASLKYSYGPHIRSFGGEVSGAGKLVAPSGVAADSEGNVWVADTGHNRIQEFNSKGEFVNQFGANGQANGLFREPRGIAVDSKGNIWVADTGNNRVQELDPKGKPIRQVGSYGTGNGKFTALQGIAIDPEGHLWTVDSAGTPRVQEFSSEGTYITKFGVKGSENGQLKEPKGIAVDSKGNVWIADTGNSRIEDFNSKGEFVRKAGSAGTGNGQLKSPIGLNTDSEGNVWVADTGNNRIQEFSATGTYLSQFGTAGNNSGQFSEPRSVAIDSKGNLWVADTNNNRAQEATASEFVRKFGGESSEAGQLSIPSGVAADSKGNVWVADTGHNRVQEFDSSGKALTQFGAKGSADGLFLEPHGLAVDAEGNVWVADTGNYRVEEFNSKGEYIRKFGVKGGANGNFYSVWGVAIDPEGHVWTIDSSQTTSRAQEFNSKGEYIRKFGGSGTLTMPRGIASDSKGNIWVSDSANHAIKEFSAEGKLLRSAGEEGTGDGQFWMPEGIAVDPEGNVWVDDPGNNRVEEFSAEGSYLSQFGTPGNNDGEVSEPRGIATDSKGNLWVADTGNNRAQEYTGSEFVRKFGGEGSGAGQLSIPNGVATDSKGNVWVADTGHNRVQKFNSRGEFVLQFSAAAPGEGPLYSPIGTAVDSKDNVWVVDGKGVQEFSPEGKYLGSLLENGESSHVEALAIDPEGHFWIVKDSGTESYVQELATEGKVLRQFGSKGTADGQFENPKGIAIDPKGNVWVADTDNWRVQEFNPKGEFIGKFGSSGTEYSTFWYPDALAADSEGHIWVADEGGARVQEFSATGTSLGQFGTAGNSDGQLFEPHGVAVDTEGTLWVADRGNNRIEEFAQLGVSSQHLTGMEVENPWRNEDPAVAVKIGNGLVKRVEGEQAGWEGEEAGTDTYSYEAGYLVAKNDEEGETQFGRDSSGRLNWIELPNGTTASIEYDLTSRATQVTVTPDGEAAKTTHFWYGEEPRETRVWGGDTPEVVYDIGEDGSVLGWSYAESPPAFDPKSWGGSLWSSRNSTEAIENKDHLLFVTATSPHEIASIQVLVNGNAVVADKTCEDTSQPPAHNCDAVKLEWITNATAHAAGRLDLEVVATDFLGHSTAERFFVTIPQQPPPDPEAPEAPTFEGIKQFREDFGLDREHNYTEQQMNQLILELLFEWESQRPAALLSVEKWGVPLRTPEIEELEYRERYVEQFVELIPEWAEENAPSTYGGYYVDDRAGGRIYVGFTANQQGMVGSLRQTPGLIAPSQIFEYPTPPTTPVVSLEATEKNVVTALQENASALAATTAVAFIPETGVITVRSTSPSVVQNYLVSRFGTTAPIEVTADNSPIMLTLSRYQAQGPVAGGQDVHGFNRCPLEVGKCEYGCTAGFGARSQVGEQQGQSTYKYFSLTAGHCFEYGSPVSRPSDKNLTDFSEIGAVRRSSWSHTPDTDGEGVLIDPVLRSHGVFFGDPKSLLPMFGVQRPKFGMKVCWSGVSGGVHCGTVKHTEWKIDESHLTDLVLVNGPAAQGDSGGPVWNPYTEKAVGLISAQKRSAQKPCHELPKKVIWCPLMLFTPLLPFQNRSIPAGIQPMLGVEVLKDQ
jgi:sugar lactone lactonase YvrE